MSSKSCPLLFCILTFVLAQFGPALASPNRLSDLFSLTRFAHKVHFERPPSSGQRTQRQANITTTTESPPKTTTTISKNRVDKIKDQIEELIERGDFERLRNLVRALENKAYQFRLARCVAVLRSRAVCQNGVSFNIWASMLAQQLMAENVAVVR